MPAVVEITPLEGVGAVRFGMPRAAARAAVGEPARAYRKAPEARHEADAFDRSGLHVHYRDADPAVECVEAVPADGVTFVLGGVEVFERPADEVRAALAAQTDVIAEEGGRTYVLPEWDVALWRPSPDAPRFTGVGVAEPGYYRLAAV